MAYLGTISEFSNTQKSWIAYVERLVQYLAANKIEDADQQQAILLSVCGPATYQMICNLMSPKKPDYDPILATVRIFVKQGWPKSAEPEFHTYYSRKLELSIQDNCILWEVA